MKKINFKFVLIFSIGVFFGLICVAVFRFFAPFLNSADSVEDYQEIRQKGFKYISPLLECESFEGSESISITSTTNALKREIEEYKQSLLVSQASVYYRDLNNGPWFTINEEMRYEPASLFKVPILLAYLKLAQDEPEILTKLVVPTISQEPLEQKFNSTAEIDDQQEYSINDLLERLIVDSDNSVLEILLNNLDKNILLSTETELSLYGDNSNNDGQILTSVNEYAGIFRRLYNASYLDNEMSEKALEMLSRVRFDKGLKAGMPQDIIVAHKFGERTYVDSFNQPISKQLHDCGIVYHPKRPYILCVMTSGQDLIKQSSLIEEISRKVYEMVEGEQEN